MTELEQQLLKLVTELTEQHEQQREEFASMFSDLERFYKTTQQENAALRMSVQQLTERVEKLSRLLPL
ncbi:MbeD/MobD family mobilization/exclusion protein [Shewanella xiamenensis]|jgi:polyhydroxyalkanoate synthesis regulator phasin|uniref:MbeD/MobD family mobilization/exclusion protein n=1 Tax=Shewanella xiamenensis TaxID=332186 RepID=UPI0021779C17|nr:hypothetical protein NUITMVS3_44390 [Shewanella xiamenensis]